MKIYFYSFIVLLFFLLSTAKAQNQFSFDTGIGLAKGFNFPETEKGVPMQEQKYSAYFYSAGYQTEIGFNYTKNKKHQFRTAYSYREHQYEYALGDYYNLGGSKLVFSLNLYELSYKYGLFSSISKHQLWTGLGFYKEDVRERRLFSTSQPSILIDETKNNFYPKENFGNSFLLMYEWHTTKRISLALQSQIYFQWNTQNITHFSILPKFIVCF